MTKPKLEDVPKALDAIADLVLAYKPKPKTKPRKEAQEARRETCEGWIIGAFRGRATAQIGAPTLAPLSPLQSRSHETPSLHGASGMALQMRVTGSWKGLVNLARLWVGFAEE